MGSVEGNELGTPAPHKLSLWTYEQWDTIYLRLECDTCREEVEVSIPSVDEMVWWQAEHNRQLGLEWREYIPIEHISPYREFNCEFAGTDTTIHYDDGIDPPHVPPLYIKVE